MYDTIEQIRGSSIQHGKSNDRIYLMKLAKQGYPQVLDDIEELAQQQSYSKIFAKVPGWAKNEFQRRNYVKEAHIPEFYNGDDSVYFMSRFLDRDRAEAGTEQQQLISKNLNIAKNKNATHEKPELPASFELRRLGKADTQQLASIYKCVFASYPFPIFEDEYLWNTMNDNIIYFGVYNGNDLIAAASAEMDKKAQNVEMTDFATLPEFLGNGLASHLLCRMEGEMRKYSMKLAYTIARSYSVGMNVTFAKSNYIFAGTLINNTNIFGNIESMNVWYKRFE